MARRRASGLTLVLEPPAARAIVTARRGAVQGTRLCCRAEVKKITGLVWILWEYCL